MGTRFNLMLAARRAAALRIRRLTAEENGHIIHVMYRIPAPSGPVFCPLRRRKVPAFLRFFLR